MLNKLSSLLLFFLGFAVLGCSENNVEAVSIQDLMSLESNVSVVQFVESEKTLDLPYTVEQLKNPKTTFSDEDIAKLKAIAYRFYSHVNVQDDLYVLSVNKSEELNISDQIFVAMKENLEETNAFFKENRKKGIPTNVPEFTEEILNSLLR